MLVLNGLREPCTQFSPNLDVFPLPLTTINPCYPPLQSTTSLHPIFLPPLLSFCFHLCKPFSKIFSKKILIFLLILLHLPQFPFSFPGLFPYLSICHLYPILPLFVSYWHLQFSSWCYSPVLGRTDTLQRI